MPFWYLPEQNKINTAVEGLIFRHRIVQSPSVLDHPVGTAIERPLRTLPCLGWQLYYIPYYIH
jgi:hypothetical protein